MNTIFTIRENTDPGNIKKPFLLEKRVAGSKHSMQWAMSREDLVQLYAVIDEHLTPICKHCGQTLNDEGTLHTYGAYRGKMRCDPEASGLPYGYDAAPVGTECKYPCLGVDK